MLFSDVHTHTYYCDGFCSPEEMVCKAIEKGLKTIGISTHGPLPLESKYAIDYDKIDEYINRINALKAKYKNQIDVLAGLEIDYFTDTEFSHIDKELFNKLDYWIGSIHFLGRFENGEPWAIDTSKLDKIFNGIQYSYNGDSQKAITAYYQGITRMVKKYKPPILGHIDIVKKSNKNNIIFDENSEWYKNLVTDCLDSISSENTVVEINTGAMSRGFRDDQYPADWILEEIRKRDIPVMINSDAHKSENIAFAFDDMYKLVKKMNLKNTVALTSCGFKNIYSFL